MKEPPLAALHALLGTPADAAVLLERLDILDWGAQLLFAGKAGGQPFELRYADCRDLRWRVYVTDRATETPLVSFAPGRDGHRSPAQFLTAHFGLALYYGSVRLTMH